MIVVSPSVTYIEVDEYLKILKHRIDDVCDVFLFLAFSWQFREVACYARKPQKFDTTVATSIKFMNNQLMS